MLSVEKPIFSGKRNDWANFELDWDRYLTKLASGFELNDAMRLSLFEACLDATNKRLLKLEQTKKRGAVTFVEFVDLVKGKYGRDGAMWARKVWSEVQLPNSGKINNEVWADFEISWKTAWANVPGATTEESHRLLVNRLPVLSWWLSTRKKRSPVSMALA